MWDPWLSAEALNFFAYASVSNAVVLGKRSCLYDQRAILSQYLFEGIYIWVVHKLQSRGNHTCNCRDIVNDYQAVALI